MPLDTIIISGLRRSGTTALWQCFRGLDGVQVFDEPFHPRLAEARAKTPPREPGPSCLPF